MKKTILLLLAIVSLSCKNTDQQAPIETLNTEIQEKKPEIFTIEVSFKVDKDDELRLFANGIFINNSRTMNISITEQISKNENGKTIVFNLPEKIKPDYEVGINLGSNEIKRIEFLEVKVSYGDNEFIATPDKIAELFYLNEYVDYTPESGVIQTKKINGKHNPIMYLKANIVDQLSL